MSTPACDHDGDAPLVGRPPAQPPPRVADFDDLDRRSIDALVDATKYISTAAGVVMAFYSQSIQDYFKPDTPLISSSGARLLVLSPLLMWFITIVATVLGIFPQQYRATTDLEKEEAVRCVRARKRYWLTLALILFLFGFSLFLYNVVARAFGTYPFR